ncbi:MAG: hypothetical protein SFU86_04635 [Pirellulaceae bacterium]|nr:hypothetical protein [Pirellulaceae bacterium]
MGKLAVELDQAMNRVDSETAALLERWVREALALAALRVAQQHSRTDSLGYPLGYFEATAGSFADETLEEPADLPDEPREPW